MIYKIPLNKDNFIWSHNSQSYNYGLAKGLYVGAYTYSTTTRVKLRTLLGFDLTGYNTKISDGTINKSQISSSYLYLYVQPTTESISVADDVIEIARLSSASWDEGSGSIVGANSSSSDWISSSYGVPWVSAGGDYLTSSNSDFITITKQYDHIKHELSQSWFSGSTITNGLLIKMKDSFETDLNNDYWHTLYSRHTNNNIYEPKILVYIYDDIQDNRRGLRTNQSCSLYLYNYDNDGVRVNHSASITSCSFYAYAASGSVSATLICSSSVTSSYTGIYATSLYLTSSYSGTIYDCWKDSNGLTVATSSASITDFVRRFTNYTTFTPKTIVCYPVIKPEYNTTDLEQIRVYFYRTRSFERTGSLNEKVINRECYYGVIDQETGYKIIDFDTCTRLSCDSESNYFNFDFGVLPEGREVRFIFKVVENNKIKVLDNEWIFKTNKIEDIQ